MHQIHSDSWPFEFIDPNKIPALMEVVRGDGALADVQITVLSITEIAMVCFRGEFPLQTPYCDEFHTLPWRDEYWNDQRKGRVSVDDFRPFLYSLDQGGDPPNDRLASSLRPHGKKEAIQGLAVEIVMFADECLWHLREGDHVEAMRYLAAAYTDLFDITIEVNQMYPALWVPLSEWIAQREASRRVVGGSNVDHAVAELEPNTEGVANDLVEDDRITKRECSHAGL